MTLTAEEMLAVMKQFCPQLAAILNDPDKIKSIVEAAMHVLAETGHLHNKGSDYTPSGPRIDISFACGGTTYHLFLYTGN
jgi:hypothetical protein